MFLCKGEKVPLPCSNQGTCSYLHVILLTRSVSDYECGEPGDFYAWDPAVWQDLSPRPSGLQQLLPLTKEHKQSICSNQPVFYLAQASFAKAQEICSILTRGKLTDILAMEEGLIENKRDTNYAYWLPYSDKKEEGKFINIYSGVAINDSLFDKGQPNGGLNQQCLELSGDRISDAGCGDELMSICEPLVDSPKTFHLRGKDLHLMGGS